MAIFEGTRYENSEAIGIQKTGERTKIFVSKGKRINKEDTGKTFDIVKQVQRLYIDLIAAARGNSLAYHVICDVNDILDPFEVIEGKEIYIPPEEFFNKVE